jgi:hypothetical protein
MSDVGHLFRGAALYKNPICAASYFVCFVDAIFANQSVCSVESVFKGLIGQRWAIRDPGSGAKKR